MKRILNQLSLQTPINISIRQDFSDIQPIHFGSPPASVLPLVVGKFNGDTRMGGSCNVDDIRIIPHCNGTHTECIGHITDERIAICDVLTDLLSDATLITVTPVEAQQTTDSYIPGKQPGDLLITSESLVAALPADNAYLDALIIRTRPNDESKRHRNYLDAPAPYFSLEAIRLISELPVRHLLVDLPSLDRSRDEGLLNAHRIFWNVAAGSRQANAAARRDRTITEMVYIADDIRDGHWLVSIQIPHFVSDAVPSRVLLYDI